MELILTRLELWQIFHKLDADGSGHIDARDVSLALNSAGEQIYVYPENKSLFTNYRC